ncbi:hypothetical protein PsalMR5_01971 [Piscirickettsia salmonis]|uniref:hypothetical protein n=1 Tax=Piscirickettsia salmonis TaxID=1238 RepID=UPI0012BA6144|nr:hypothetical protein [Piscirickettsia salmonis]QGP54697.1 hypothetical protein PsalSR1_02138 [Piscirickettsia salmonis]QGP59406.1 hypothetical protein PsalBI1_01994 [Piscirickettsia salmonis]QGP64106.1 hypothetical protein PsalMR5_01971 [Piscirickettsia salmonis]
MKVTLNLGELEAKREGFNFTVKDGGELKVTASGIEYKAKGKKLVTKVTWAKLGGMLGGDSAPKKKAAAIKKPGRPKKAAVASTVKKVKAKKATTAKKTAAKKPGRPKKAATVKKTIAARKVSRPKKTVAIKRKSVTARRKVKARK